jgi:hypothetical protein
MNNADIRSERVGDIISSVEFGMENNGTEYGKLVLVLNELESDIYDLVKASCDAIVDHIFVTMNSVVIIIISCKLLAKVSLSFLFL